MEIMNIWDNTRQLDLCMEYFFEYNDEELKKAKMFLLNINNFTLNKGMVDVDYHFLLLTRICIKALFASILNITSIFLIMTALNLIVDVKNFIVISCLVLLGTYHLLGYGFIINTIVRAFYLRREIIIVFEIAFLLLYFTWNSDSYIFPITILMTQLSGVLTDDILYSKFMPSEVAEYWGLWLGIVIVSAVVIFISNRVTSLLLSRDTYGRKNEK